VDERGFDFQPQPRRESRQFEPPPWEQEAFEELQRKRAEEAEAERLLQARAEPEPPADSEPVAVQAATQPETVPEGEQPAAGELDEARVTAMLAELAEEEPRARGLWRVALVVALLLGAIGMVLTAWGFTALMAARGGGALALMGGSFLLMFGIGFIATAVWLGVRTLRQQGVL